MEKIKYQYRLPASGPSRELLRQKGQFWTPDWVAEAMVSYVLSSHSRTIFDPAVGAGAFFRAAKIISTEIGRPVSLLGMENDSTALEQALEQGLTPDDLSQVTVGDFVIDPPPGKFPAIVANPPYIRHHRLSVESKALLKQISTRILGKAIDGRAGLHVYFLLRALAALADDGRLAFIMPADTCEGRFAPELWRWIVTNFALDAVITFSPEASPFPNVDTNPLIFLIRKAMPRSEFYWAKCLRSGTSDLQTWIRNGLSPDNYGELHLTQRAISEGLKTGFSRPPSTVETSKHTIGDFVRVMRGIATGANDFFFLTAAQVEKTGIPFDYFVRAIGRTRDVPGNEITQATLDMLDASGRPTFLLSVNDKAYQEFPDSLEKYIQYGEKVGLPNRPLISQRKPWYKMESRLPPPFLFAYLGRRNIRFIRNLAGVVPLTGFLCLYPKFNDLVSLEQLWRVLNDARTVANLYMIGKSYGGGAIKVEPRALEKLPLSDDMVESVGIQMQLRLFEQENTYRT